MIYYRSKYQKKKRLIEETCIDFGSTILQNGNQLVFVGILWFTIKIPSLLFYSATRRFLNPKSVLKWNSWLDFSREQVRTRPIGRNWGHRAASLMTAADEFEKRTLIEASLGEWHAAATTSKKAVLRSACQVVLACADAAPSLVIVYDIGTTSSCTPLRFPSTDRSKIESSEKRFVILTFFVEQSFKMFPLSVVSIQHNLNSIYNKNLELLTLAILIRVNRN